MSLRTGSLLSLFCGILLVLGPAGARFGSDGLDAQVLQGEDFRWQGRLEPGSIVEIKGVNGPVVAERATGDEVEVRAFKRWRRDDPDGVQIEVLEHRGGVTICAIYPSRRWDRENYCAPGADGRQNSHDNDVKVRFEIDVPEGIEFVGKTVNGDVDARDLTSDVYTHTVNGDVRVETEGRAEGSTVNGSITVRMGRADWDHDVEFTTVNGSITLYLPGEFSAEVRAETLNGYIETDFPMMVRGRSRWGPRRLSGVIGQGGREVYLKTVNGSIRLRVGR